MAPFAAESFIHEALVERAIQINNDGRPLCSYLYTADLCVRLLRLLESGTLRQAYNVSTEQALSIASLAQYVVGATVQTMPIKVQTQDNPVPPKPSECDLPDKYKVRHSLDTALRKNLQWTRQRAMAP